MASSPSPSPSDVVEEIDTGVASMDVDVGTTDVVDPAHEMNMTMQHASQLTAMMPAIGNQYFAGLDPEFANALTKSCQRMTASNAVMVASVHRSLLKALDHTVERMQQHTIQEVKKSEERVTKALREEFQTAQIVVEKRMTGVNKQIEKLQTTVENYDPTVSLAWKNPANVHLRQIVAWILYMGLDTANTQGMTPLIAFSFLPNLGKKEENHVTIMPKALFRMLLMHGQNFNIPVNTGIQAKVEKIIIPVFSCLTSLKAEQLRKWEGLFPCVPFSSGGVYVFYTKHLIRLMQEEKSYIDKGESMIKTDNDFVVESKVDESGKLHLKKFQSSSSKSSDVCKPLRPKSVINRFRRFVGTNIESLVRFAKEIYKKHSKDATTLYNFTSVRRYWNQPASKEHLSQIAFHMGVAMIRRDVFGQTTPMFNPEQPFHIGVHWKIDRKTKVKSFGSIMGQKLGLDEAKYMEYFDLEVQDDPLGETTEDEEQTSPPSRSTRSQKTTAFLSDTPEPMEDDAPQDDISLSLDPVSTEDPMPLPPPKRKRQESSVEKNSSSSLHLDNPPSAKKRRRSSRRRNRRGTLEIPDEI